MENVLQSDSTSPTPQPISTTQPEPVIKKSGIAKPFFLSLALILLGTLIGVLATRYLPSLDSLLPPVTPTVSPSPIIGDNTSPSSSPAIDVTTGWSVFRDTNTGFEFKYPATISLNIETKGSPVSVINTKITPIDKIIDEPLGYNKSTAIKDEASLLQGKFGEHLSFGLFDSEKVFQIGNIFGKTFTTLQIIEVCDVRFTRTAIIYYKGYQIIVSYNGPKSLIDDSSDYFTKDATSCGNFPVWKKDNTFYQDLSSSKAPQEAQKWFDTFDQILSTFKFSDSPELSLKYPITNNLEKNLYLVFPKGTSIEKNIITLGNSSFQIKTSVGPGLCPMDSEGDSCTYTDQPGSKWGYYRVWTKSTQPFAVNPQSITIEGVYSDGLIITKSAPNTIFSEAELNQWKEIINSVGIGE